jgi:hypothetical protein
MWNMWNITNNMVWEYYTRICWATKMILFSFLAWFCTVSG